MPEVSMGLRTRLKNRLRGLVSSEVGDGFSSTHDVVFARFDHNAEAAFQLVGAAVVGTWEVAITDVARAYEGFLPESDVPALSERMSDAIVPFLTPLQGAGNKFRAALKDGVKVALGTGKLQDATRPMARVLWSLAEPTAEGWVKTAQYMAPLVERLDRKEAVEAALAAAGDDVKELLASEAGVFATAMDALPGGSELEGPMNEALERYRKNVAAGLEQILYAQRQVLVDAARQQARR